MSVSVTDEHDALAASVRRWLDAHCPPGAARALLDAEVESLQPVWGDLGAEGWLGIHLPERWGGQGAGLFELAVVLEETGRAMLPGPVLPTVVVAAAVAEQVGTAAPPVPDGVVSDLAGGTVPAALALGVGAFDGRIEAETGSLSLSGHLGPVPGAQVAGVALVPVRVGSTDGGAAPGVDGDPVCWCLVDVVAADDRAGGGDALVAHPRPSLDPTRRVGVLEAEGAVLVPPGRQLPGLTTGRLRQLAVVLACAELCGVAGWCLDTASEYAKVRRQFGRPIGQFQAVKHRLADMVVRIEQATALTWDAVRAVEGVSAGAGPGGGDDDRAGPGGGDDVALAVAAAGAHVLDAAVESAKDCVQLLGGIGFTWEHDAHLYLRRAVTTRQLLAPKGGADSDEREVVRLARLGVRRSLGADLPAEADAARAEFHELVAGIGALPVGERREAMADAGLVSPHWPAPYGRDSSAVEQVVIDDELGAAGVSKPHLGVGAWALPVIIAHGTEAQRERWVRPTLVGDLTWCQLFSEPGAGSDLASLTTRAERTDGGWLLTGQKVWTSMAQHAQWGICLARTDPAVPKHEGITYFIVDMAAPGLDVRPLRELTGDAMFNEVFLDEVFVPDDCVIGGPGEGWAMARATLANERVSMSSGATFGVGVESLLRTTGRHEELTTVDTDRRLGALLVEAQSLRLLSHRATLRTLAGSDAAATTSVRKLLGVEHEQRVQEEGLTLYGPAAAALEGSPERWARGFLVTRCLTIAGGTSEIQRNVIAERILGLPRDPDPTG